MDDNGIWHGDHRFVEDDWNINTTTHTIEPSSLSLLLCIGNNNVSNSTIAPSMPYIGSLCTYPNGTTIQNHTLPPNYYGYGRSTITNNANETKEGMLVGAIFSASMITSLLLTTFLYRRYKEQSHTSSISSSYRIDITSSIHNSRNSHYYRHRHNPTTTETTSIMKENNVQEEYTRIEESLCNMYVMEHNSEFCHHHDDDINNNDKHTTMNYENENDVIIDYHYHPYDIESYGEDLSYDTNFSLHHNMNKHCHNNVLTCTLSTCVHSINTSCCSSCNCNNSTGRNDDDDDITVGHNNDNNECPICLEHFSIGQIVSISPSLCSCQHIFHHVCIKEWLLKNKTCPSCRQVYFNDDIIDIDITDVENMNHNNIIIIDHENDTDNKTNMSLESIMKTNENNNDMIMFYCICHGISYCQPSPKSISNNNNNNNNNNMHQSKMIQLSSLSLGNNSIIDNNDTKNQVHHDTNVLSVPTPSELANMRIQHEQPTISSSLQKHIYQNDNIPHHHNDDDTINHNQETEIPNGTITSTDLDTNNNNIDNNYDRISFISTNLQQHDSTIITTTTTTTTTTKETSTSTSRNNTILLQGQYTEQEDDNNNQVDDVIVNHYDI